MMLVNCLRFATPASALCEFRNLEVQRYLLAPSSKLPLDSEFEVAI